MHRSRTQIATSYAPGALFTYEGGLGCCVSVPISTPYTPSSLAVPRQLFEHLSEYVESWFERAMRCRTQPEVLPKQCLDSVFLNYEDKPLVDPGRFTLNQPSRIGFVPNPLVFVCSNCGLLTEFDDIDDLHNRWTQTENRADCRKSESDNHHNWRQIDVIFAHWSGNYSGLSPHRWLMAPDGKINQSKKCQNCGHGEYRLVTKSSPFFSDWKFQCVKCLALKDVVQADRETLALLKPRMDAGYGNLPKEWNMLPVSYRASSVFYVQTDSFIQFHDTEIITLLSTAHRNDLVAHLAKLYGFPGTPMSDEEVIRQLIENGRDDEADEYRGLVEIAATLSAERKRRMEKQLDDKRVDYERNGFIAKQHQQSPTLVQQVERSQSWARRYNPIRLAIEHVSLRSEVIERQGTDPTLPAISVCNPQICDIDSQDVRASKAYTELVQQYLAQLGIDKMVMLRSLDICEFSFGYTRVGFTPSTTEKDLEMPVCLRAFDYVEKRKRPIYVLEQKNEGFYVQLNETRVIDWLIHNGLGDDLTASRR